MRTGLPAATTKGQTLLFMAMLLTPSQILIPAFSLIYVWQFEPYRKKKVKPDHLLLRDNWREPSPEGDCLAWISALKQLEWWECFVVYAILLYSILVYCIPFKSILSHPVCWPCRKPTGKVRQWQAGSKPVPGVVYLSPHRRDHRRRCQSAWDAGTWSSDM